MGLRYKVMQLEVACSRKEQEADGLREKLGQKVWSIDLPGFLSLCLSHWAVNPLEFMGSVSECCGRVCLGRCAWRGLFHLLAHPSCAHICVSPLLSCCWPPA